MILNPLIISVESCGVQLMEAMLDTGGFLWLAAVPFVTNPGESGC